ncbi:MAG: aldose epimerase family protein [Opitutia bacterium]
MDIPAPVLALVGCAAVALILAVMRRRRPGNHLSVTQRLLDGSETRLHTLTNARGMSVSVSSYGATLTSVRVPDISGEIGEVTLGLETAEELRRHRAFLGSTVGRYANRLAGGRLTVDGRIHEVDRNDGPNHLHGGAHGLDAKVWTSAAGRTEEAGKVTLRVTSPAGEGGYPGELRVTVTYSLSDRRNELTIRFEAECDAPTACNLTNHAFFNLSGRGAITDHRLRIAAERFIPVDANLIATGELAPVEGTPFDFRNETAIGARITDPHPQLRLGRGYDHCYVLGGAGTMRVAAEARDPSSGRTLQLLTDAPGVQLYTGNFLDGSVRGRWATPYGFRQGFCLEPGLFPDSPTRPEVHRLGFPTGILRPGEKYAQTMVLRFGVIHADA